jgi:hypothetical protein
MKWKCEVCGVTCVFEHTAQPTQCPVAKAQADWKATGKTKIIVQCARCNKSFEVKGTLGKTDLNCFKHCSQCQVEVRAEKVQRRIENEQFVLEKQLRKLGRDREDKHILNSLSMEDNKLVKCLKDGDFYVG